MRNEKAAPGLLCRSTNRCSLEISHGNLAENMDREGMVKDRNSCVGMQMHRAPVVFALSNAEIGVEPLKLSACSSSRNRAESGCIPKSETVKLQHPTGDADVLTLHMTRLFSAFSMSLSALVRPP